MDETKKKAMELLARAHRERSPYSRKAGVLEKGMVHPDDASAISAIIAALSAAPQVPEGWVLVPVEPTEEMIEAYHCVEAVSADSDESADDQWAIESYRAMLAAKPEQP